MRRKSRAELYTPQLESQYFQYYRDNLELARRYFIDGVSVRQLAREYEGGLYSYETIHNRIKKAHSTLFALDQKGVNN